jgi:hypothetical protein
MQEKNKTMILKLQEEYISTGFEVPSSFTTLPAITELDPAWKDCYNKQWFNPLNELVEVDLSDFNTFARLMRFEYCTKVQSNDVLEDVYQLDIISEVNNDKCIQTSGVKELAEKLFEIESI